MLVFSFVLVDTSLQGHDASGEKFTVLYDGCHSLHGDGAFYSRFNSIISTQFTIKCACEPLTKENLSNYDILVFKFISIIITII